MPTGLATRLRHATSDLHARVERTGVMRQLLKGEVERESYARLLRNLHAIYVALEDALARHAAHAQLAALYRPALCRRAALDDDLQCLHGPDWSDAIELDGEAQRYAERLASLADAEPLRLAAHAYVRYLGDLSGGQIVAGLLTRRLGLQRDAGLRFYDFGDAAQVAMHAAALRAALDAIGEDETVAVAIIDEAGGAFERHARLFEALAVAPPVV